MRFRTWLVAAIGMAGLLLLIVVSMLTTSRKAQEIYTQLDQLNARLAMRQHDRAILGQHASPARRAVRRHHVMLGAHAEVDHLGIGCRGHLGDQRIVGVEHRGAIAPHGFDHHLLHARQLFDGVDPA